MDKPAISGIQKSGVSANIAHISIAVSSMLLMPFVFPKTQLPGGQLEIADMCKNAAPAVVTAVTRRFP